MVTAFANGSIISSRTGFTTLGTTPSPPLPGFSWNLSLPHPVLDLFVIIDLYSVRLNVPCVHYDSRTAPVMTPHI